MPNQDFQVAMIDRAARQSLSSGNPQPMIILRRVAIALSCLTFGDIPAAASPRASHLRRERARSAPTTSAAAIRLTMRACITRGIRRAGRRSRSPRCLIGKRSAGSRRPLSPRKRYGVPRCDSLRLPDRRLASRQGICRPHPLARWQRNRHLSRYQPAPRSSATCSFWRWSAAGRRPHASTATGGR